MSNVKYLSLRVYKLLSRLRLFETERLSDGRVKNWKPQNYILGTKAYGIVTVRCDLY